jgi:hypothetical protein
VLLIVKRLLLLSIVENIWMKRFGLQEDQWVVFPLCKTLTEDILLFMMKRALQKLVFPFINVVIFGKCNQSLCQIDPIEISIKNPNEFYPCISI